MVRQVKTRYSITLLKKYKGEIMLNIKEYGVKKTWDKKWETFANVKDGKYLIPITWMKGKFKSKSKAINWIETQVKLFSLRDN